MTDVFNVLIGFGPSVTGVTPLVVPSPVRYLLMLTFSAVLPLPNRSYTTWLFGVKSL